MRGFLYCAAVLSQLGLICASGSAAAPGDSFPQYFRCDNGVGSGAGPLPAQLDAAGALRWRVELDAGHSSPILADGKIFLTTCREETRELAVVALDQQSGREVWRRPVEVPKLEQTHAIGSPATATPACDGERVFAFFGSYGMLCYDRAGNKLWERRLGPFQDEYGAGSSPIVLDDKVILNQDHDKGSFVMAMDTRTGNTIWKHDRPDAVRSYSTPTVWDRNDHREILVAGALELISYAPATGEKLWSAHGLARIVIPTPVAAGDWVYMASWAPGGDIGQRLALDAWPIALAKWDKNQDGKLAKAEINDPEVLDRFYRIDLNQDGFLDQREWERHAAVFSRAQNALLAFKPTSKGELSDTELYWKHMRGVPYVSSPLLDQGRIWMVKDGGIVTKLDAKDGSLLQEERLPANGRYFASPVAGDGKVIFASETGVLTLVANERDWRVISSYRFHEKIFATPALRGNRIYLRTEKALYCFQGQITSP